LEKDRELLEKGRALPTRRAEIWKIANATVRLPEIMAEGRNG
jgi:hypothetical protein